MLPDEMEAEKNRKIILTQANKLELLEKNAYNLQEQLQTVYNAAAGIYDGADDSFTTIQTEIGCGAKHNYKEGYDIL